MRYRFWRAPEAVAASPVLRHPLARRLQLRYSLSTNRVSDASTAHHLVHRFLL